MAVAYQSISNTGWTSWDGTTRVVTITKPTGLAIGDLMVTFLATNISPSSGWDTLPSGFTFLGEDGTVTGILTNSYALSIYSKVADSGDTAASNFSFTQQAGTGGAGETGAGSILRFSGGYLDTNFLDVSLDNNGGTTNNYVGGVNPLVADSILIMAVLGHSANTTVSNYAVTTSNPTWTERQDAGTADSSDYTFAIATGPRSASTATGDYSADFASSVAKSVGILAAVIPPTSVTVTPAVISMASSVQAPSLTGGATVSPTVISMASAVQAPTVAITAAKWSNNDKTSTASFTNPDKSSSSWTNPDKSSSSWTNPDKS